MTVSIEVDLDAQIEGEITKIKGQLEALEEDLNLGDILDEDIGEKLSDLGDSLDELGESFIKGLDEQITRLEDLELDTLEFEGVPPGGGDSGGDTGSDSGDYIPSPEQFYSNGVLTNDSTDEDDTPLRKALNQVSGADKSIRDFNTLESVFDNFSRRTPSPEILEDFKMFGGGDSLEIPKKEDGDVDYESLQQSIDESFGDIDFSVDKDATEENDNGKIYGQGSFGTTALNEELARNGYGTTQTVDEDGNKVNYSSENVETSAPGEGPDFSKREPLDGLKNKVRKVAPNGLGEFDSIGKMTESLRGMRSPLKRLLPSMSTYINLVAKLIPALGMAAIQAAGVAASMGAVAGAGAAMIGLGLVGHGKNMAQSFAMAKSQLKDLKKDLFQTFQPVAQQFAPISEQFLNFAPGQLDKIAESMEGLTKYKDTIFQMFKGGTEFVSAFIDQIVANEDAITQLATRFSSLLGTEILKFFDWLIQSVSKNQETLVQLGLILKKIGISLFNVFKFVSKLAVAFMPLFNIVKGFTDLLNNSLFAGMITFLLLGAQAISMAVSLGTAIAGLSGILAGVGSALITITSVLATFITEGLLATITTYGLAEAIGVLIGTASLLAGIGIAAWAAYQASQGIKQAKKVQQMTGQAGGSGSGVYGGSDGGGFGGQSGGSSGGSTTINVHGDPSESKMQGMKDIAFEQSKNYDYQKKTRKPPSGSGS